MLYVQSLPYSVRDRSSSFGRLLDKVERLARLRLNAGGVTVLTVL